MLLPMQSRRPPVQEVCGYHDGRIGEARETGNSRPWPLARSKQVENLRPRRAANRWKTYGRRGRQTGGKLTAEEGGKQVENLRPKGFGPGAKVVGPGAKATGPWGGGIGISKPAFGRSQ